MLARPIYLVALLLFATPEARAATFCVGTAAALNSALQTAAGNGEDDVIRIRTGTYVTAGGNTAFYYATGENFDLALQGGWITFLTQPCGLQVLDPRLTVLSGSGVRRVLRMAGSSGTSGDLSVEGMTLRDGATPVANDGVGGGLYIGAPGFSGDVAIERVLFESNTAQVYGGGLLADLDGGGFFVLRNSVFRLNTIAQLYGAAYVRVNAASTVQASVLIGNNTFVSNGCSAGAPSSCNGALRITGNARMALVNNAFAFNTGLDVVLGSSPIDFRSNNALNVSGTPETSSGNFALADPQFVSAGSGDYRLRFESPLRDSGSTAYLLSAVDFDGLPRLNDTAPDIGAFENDAVVFRNSFEQP